MIDLESRQRGLVMEILAEQAPHCAVWAFGSRATGKARAYSDLDLALLGPEPLGRAALGRLQEAFAESELNIRVDVVDWRALSAPFRAAIAPHCIPLRPPANGPIPPADRLVAPAGYPGIE